MSDLRNNSIIGVHQQELAAPRRVRAQKRLNANISASKYALLQETLDQYGLKMAEGIRIGINILAAVLPVLAKGGELVFREPNGEERVYVFPFLVN